MIVPDVNLLIYAYDSTSSDHLKAKEWWESALAGREPIGIPWIVTVAFVRLMTHAGICNNPLDIGQARKSVEFWLEFSHVRLLIPTTGTFQIFFDLLEAAGSGGNLTTDALIAAHALEHSAVVFSNDRDFKRFPNLRCRYPLRSAS